MEKEGEDEMESRGGEVGTVCLVALVLNEMMHFQSISGKKVPARKPYKRCFNISENVCVDPDNVCVQSWCGGNFWNGAFMLQGYLLCASSVAGVKVGGVLSLVRNVGSESEIHKHNSILDPATEKKDVRFWPVNHVVHPSTRLLNAQSTPFRLAQQVGLGVLRLHLL